MTKFFGTLNDGRPVERVLLENAGLRAWVITRGATLQDLRLDGVENSLVLGFERLEDYLACPQYFGANVGRFANRINKGRAAINGCEYQFDCNEHGIQTLHGGSNGSAVRLWKILKSSKDEVILGDHLDDGHMGFPGNMQVTLGYKITKGPSLEIEICATCDQPSLCNFAHHSYFNLDGSADILDHRLQIEAEHYLPVNENKIPTGKLQSVGASAFDFRQSRPIAWQDKAFGYDHNFCLSDGLTSPRKVARLHSLKSDLTMTLITNQPGLQVYDGASTICPQDQTLSKNFGSHAGIALEPQLWPDAPNHKNFPNAELSTDAKYRQLTIFQFH